ncbi:MAG: protein BatD [Alistipes sp.]|nr:protein BatD [Alistipes sp.]
MNRFIKNILCTLAAVLSFTAAYADGDVTFEIKTPLMVSVGEPFRVEFVLTNGKPDKDSFSAPNFTEIGLDVLAGPTTSTARSFQSINGKSSSTSTFTITYVVAAQKAGNITIGSAHVVSDNKELSTKATPIEAIEESQQQTTNAAAEQGNALQNQLAQDDILIRLNLSRNTVYKGEPILASLTLYTRASIAGLEDAKLPSFNGFWSQELSTEKYQPQRQTVNGKVYDSQVIKEYLLYPQQSGEITIEPTTLTAVAQIVMRSNKTFDPFFGGGTEIYNVKRKLSTGAITLNVKELPAGAPASFTGAVGSFSMKASLPPTELQANSAASYNVEIAGTGNLTFLQQPKLELPSSFELYNVRSTESIQTSTAGTKGYRRFEYPFIARAEGEYDIKPIEFTYFSPEKESYITLSSEALHINITPDPQAGSSLTTQIISGVAKENVRQLGSDIRFIKLGRAQLHSSASPLMLSSTYFTLLTLILVAFVALYYTMRRRIRDSHNTVLIRTRRANKVAVQRFRMAEKYMCENNRHAFYEEMLRALWGYMSDKLNIPVSSLTKENIREELQRKGCPNDVAKLYTDIISRCDEAQYSPIESVQMNRVYEEGVGIISRIESIIKR